MAKDVRDYLHQATALAGVLSEKTFGKTLKVEIGPSVCYSKEKDTITLPGIPMGPMDEEVQDKLRAYLAHEAAGERGLSTWDVYDPRWKDDDRTRLMVNGLNDARIDTVILEKWPGSGLAIRRQVQRDLDEMKARAQTGQVRSAPDFALSIIGRYLGEGLLTLDEAIQAFPGPIAERLESCRDLFAAWDVMDEQSAIETSLAVAERLGWQVEDQDQEENAEDPEEPCDGGKGGEGQGEEGEGEGEEGQGEGQDGEGEGQGEGQESDNQGEGQGTSKKAQKPGKPGKPGKRMKPVAHNQGRPLQTTEDRLAEELAKVMRGNTDRWSPEGDPTGYTTDPSLDTRTVSRGGQRAELPQSSYRVLGATLTNTIRQITKARAPTWVRGQEQGNLDESRLADLIAVGRQDVFRRRRVQETDDLCIAMSVDASNSMNRGNIWQGVRRFAMALAQASASVEIPLWIGTWTTNNRENRNVYKTEGTAYREIKPWATPWTNPNVRGAIASMEGDGFTPMADGLGEALRQVMGRPERRKVVLFFTDGMPEMYTEGTPTVHHNMVRYLVDLYHKMGVTLLPVAIDCDRHQDNFKEFFGVDYPVAYLASNNLEQGTKDVLLKALRKIHQELEAKAA